MGKCTEYMGGKLEAVSGYDAMKDMFDLIALIKASKGLSYQSEGQNYHPITCHAVS
jgi:hypothetical protein